MAAVKTEGDCNGGSCVRLTDVLQNGDFESGTGDQPDSWTTDSWQPQAGMFRWEAGCGRNGSRCVSIQVNGDAPNDARWIQRVQLLPDIPYNLHAWSKGENIVKGSADASVGANACLMGTWWNTGGKDSLGTFDWKRVSVTCFLDAGAPYAGEKIGILSVRQDPGGAAVAGNPIQWMQSYVPNDLKANLDRFNLFLDKLTEYSGADVRNLFAAGELSWIEGQLK